MPFVDDAYRAAKILPPILMFVEDQKIRDPTILVCNQPHDANPTVKGGFSKKISPILRSKNCESFLRKCKIGLDFFGELLYNRVRMKISQ